MSLSKAEAQLTMANHVARVFQVFGTAHFTMEARLNVDGRSVEMMAYFGDLPDNPYRSVHVDLSLAGWNIFVERQWVHEFIEVCRQRLALEEFLRQYADAQTRKVINGYL